MNRKNSWETVLLGLIVCVLTACQQRAAFSHYESVPIDGWDREDTVQFMLGPIVEGNVFCETLGLRASQAFPFMNLSLIVEQEAIPSGLVRCDTINIPIIDTDGIPIGKGINHFQYNIALNDINLLTGESLFVSIRHNMKREYLPGITDVGITLTKQP